jgi:flagellar M-ring protein FliF
MSPSSVPLLRAAREMSAGRRLLVLSALAGLVVVIGLTGRWASTPNYVTLYRDLELAEAGSMSDQLQKAGIQNRLGPGGNEVQVPAAEIARARVTLAKAGLPMNGRPGLELFDKPSWGMTDFTQRVTYQRALEGELARTIAGIRGIDRAQVHLVLPVSSPLRRLERPASASVVLTLKSGDALAPDAVQGITYIVSNSVEQLSSDNVAVMDDGGHVLSVPAGEGSATLSTRQLEMQRSVESHLEAKVEGLLATVVGPGRVRAQIAAQLSFDQVDRTVETYDPDGQVLQTEQRSEGGDGAGANPQTVVSNAYQNSRKLEKSTESAGKITRLTVAVLVDEKAIQGGKGRPAVTPLSLEAMVRDAAGVDSTRGDRLTVLSVPFEAAALPPGGQAAASNEKPRTDPIQVAERVSRPLIGLVAIVALVAVAFIALRGFGGTVGVGGATAGARAEITGGAAAAAPGAVGLLLPERAAVDGANRSDATAQVVRAWLAES